MVVGRPSSQLDLLRAQTHRWSKTEPVCLDCGLTTTDDEPWVLYTTPCPGPNFTYTGNIIENICEAKHCKEHTK